MAVNIKAYISSNFFYLTFLLYFQTRFLLLKTKVCQLDCLSSPSLLLPVCHLFVFSSSLLTFKWKLFYIHSQNSGFSILISQNVTSPHPAHVGLTELWQRAGFHINTRCSTEPVPVCQDTLWWTDGPGGGETMLSSGKLSDSALLSR